MPQRSTHLAAVDTSVLDLGHDVSFACDVDTLAMGLVNGIGCLAQNGDKGLLLVWLDLESDAVSPESPMCVLSVRFGTASQSTKGLAASRAIKAIIP